MQRTEETFVFINTNSLCGTHMQIDPNKGLYNSGSKLVGRRTPSPKGRRVMQTAPIISSNPQQASILQSALFFICYCFCFCSCCNIRDAIHLQRLCSYKFLSQHRFSNNVFQKQNSQHVGVREIQKLGCSYYTRKCGEPLVCLIEVRHTNRLYPECRPHRIIRGLRSVSNGAGGNGVAGI